MKKKQEEPEIQDMKDEKVKPTLESLSEKIDALHEAVTTCVKSQGELVEWNKKWHKAGRFGN